MGEWQDDTQWSINTYEDECLDIASGIYVVQFSCYLERNAFLPLLLTRKKKICHFEVSVKIITCFPLIYLRNRQEREESEIIKLQQFFIWSSEIILFFSFTVQIYLWLFLYLWYSLDIIYSWIFSHHLLARRGLKSVGISIGDTVILFPLNWFVCNKNCFCKLFPGILGLTFR